MASGMIVLKRISGVDLGAGLLSQRWGTKIMQYLRMNTIILESGIEPYLSQATCVIDGLDCLWPTQKQAKQLDPVIGPASPQEFVS